MSPNPITSADLMIAWAAQHDSHLKLWIGAYLGGEVPFKEGSLDDALAIAFDLDAGIVRLCVDPANKLPVTKIKQPLANAAQDGALDLVEALLSCDAALRTNDAIAYALEQAVKLPDDHLDPDRLACIARLQQEDSTSETHLGAMLLALTWEYPHPAVIAAIGAHAPLDRVVQILIGHHQGQIASSEQPLEAVTHTVDDALRRLSPDQLIDGIDRMAPLMTATAIGEVLDQLTEAGIPNTLPRMLAARREMALQNNDLSSGQSRRHRA